MISIDKIPYQRHFYPRSPCGERPGNHAQPPTQQEISIHALLAESDKDPISSTSDIYISIHALLAESDVLSPEAIKTR